jgi:hypothetical protein
MVCRPRHSNRALPNGRLRTGPLAPLILTIGLALPWAAVRAEDPPTEEQGSAAPSEQNSDQKDDAKNGAAKPAATKAAEKPKATAKPAVKTAAKPAPAATPAPALRFTDDDLERFHKKPPVEAEEVEEQEPEEAGNATAMPPGPIPAGAPSVPPGGAKPGVPAAKKPAANRPAPTPAPAGDPLAPFKERERRQAMRAEQLKSLRDRVVRVQARLEYLKAKRLAIVNPLYAMPAGGSEEDQKLDGALRPKELLELVDKEIEAAGAELALSQEDLVEFETRFAGETGGP